MNEKQELMHMKLANIKTAAGIHLAMETGRGIVDLTAAGCSLSLQELICGAEDGFLAVQAGCTDGTCASAGSRRSRFAA